MYEDLFVSHPLRRRSMTALLAVTAATAAPTLALAARGSAGMHTIVNGQGAVVHRFSDRGFPQGPYIGHLTQGQGFRVDHADSDHVWCIGYAYGSVDHAGNVLCGNLSDN